MHQKLHHPRVYLLTPNGRLAVYSTYQPTHLERRNETSWLSDGPCAVRLPRLAMHASSREGNPLASVVRTYSVVDRALVVRPPPTSLGRR
jgi:hypothetical protein